MNKTNYKFWIDKHKKDKDYWAKKRASVPGPLSYSPCHVEFDTFLRTETILKKNKSKKK